MRNGRRLDMLGYTLDLDTQCASIARKNVLRCIYGFFLIGEREGTIAIHTLEKLSSWASRYSVVCVHMRPFTSILYSAMKGRGRHVSVPLTDELWRICRLFQALLVLSVVDETRFARPFAAFAERGRAPTVVIEFDGCLFGGGGLILSRLNGVETLVGGFSIDLRPLGFGTEAQYQNCAEFITLVIGIRVARQHGMDVRSILARGDSVSALQWAETTRFRSTRVTQAASVFFFQMSVYDIEEVTSIHIPAELNTRADDLSRGVGWTAMQRKYPELIRVPW